MASICFPLLFFIVFSITTKSAYGFVTIKCDKMNEVQHGHQSVLMCRVIPTEDTTDVTIRVVRWMKKGNKTPHLLFKDGKTTSNENHRFAASSWNEKNLDVSLFIKDTKVEDDGQYTCSVVTDSGDETKEVTLKVTAKYRTPTVELIKKEQTPTALHCNSTDGYPAGQIQWFDTHGTNWTKSSKLVKTKLDSGLFHLYSTLPLSTGSISDGYTCVVYNASGGKVANITKMITVYSDPEGRAGSSETSKVVAPLLVIGSLIVGLLALLLYRRRFQQDRRPSTAPLMGPHQEIPHEHEDDVEMDDGEGDSQDNDKKRKDSMA